MSLILHIETSTQNCSIAVSEHGKLLSLIEENKPNIHASAITIFIERALIESKKKIQELTAIAISKGPGSYTGLRIGTSVAKGLCYALDIPLIAIDTLKAMAYGVIHTNQNSVNKNSLLCPMIDARRMEVYSAIYDYHLNEVKKISADIIHENSYAEFMQANTLIYFGDGAEKCKNIFAKSKNAFFLDNIWPSASFLIQEAEHKLEQKQFEDVAYFEPFYLKDFLFKK